MEHFYQNIHGWPNELPEVYAEMVSNAPTTGSHFIEVGCFKGASSAAMCVEIINSGKNIKFDCIDIWGESHIELTEALGNVTWPDNALYEEFINNMKPVEGYFTAIQMSSTDAANLYEDNSLDFVCIDAAHDYENVKNDILSWLPKIKSGGVLAGDDYNWPNVKKAVNELCPNHTANIAWKWTKP